MNECLTIPQHINWSVIGYQNKVDAWNGYQIKNTTKKTRQISKLLILTDILLHKSNKLHFIIHLIVQL